MGNKNNKRKEGSAESLRPKGSTGWMSHWPQSVNEPADPCNKLLWRTAELEICRHSQNKTKKTKTDRTGRRTEGKKKNKKKKSGRSRKGCKHEA